MEASAVVFGDTLIAAEVVIRSTRTAGLVRERTRLTLLQDDPEARLGTRWGVWSEDLTL